MYWIVLLISHTLRTPFLLILTLLFHPFIYYLSLDYYVLYDSFSMDYYVSISRTFRILSQSIATFVFSTLVEFSFIGL